MPGRLVLDCRQTAAQLTTLPEELMPTNCWPSLQGRETIFHGRVALATVKEPDQRSRFEVAAEYDLAGQKWA